MIAFARIAAAAFLALGTLGPAQGADQILGPGRIDAGGNVKLPGGPTLGLWAAGKYVATPDSLQIKGAGSTGDVSGMSVAPDGAAVYGSLANLAAAVLPHVANTAALKAATILRPRVVRDGFAAPGDGGAATYTYTSAACAISGGDGGSQVPADAGGCWTIDWSSVGGEATPELFAGAVGFSVDGASGTPDAQPAVQKALDTGRPVSLRGAPFYRMGRAGVVKTPGQSIRGRGEGSALVFYPGFDTSAGSGVLTFSPAVFQTTRAQGPVIRDLRIKGFQPEVTAAGDTGTTDAQRLASLMQVSCIDARGGYGAKFHNLTLTTCMRGIDLRGDVGQTVIDGLTGSNFIADIDIDGALDTIRIRNHHNFPTNVTANQGALAKRTAYETKAGRADDLKVADSMCIAASRCFYLYQGVARTIAADGYASPGGVTVASVSNHNFDITPVGWEVSAGVLGLTGGYNASVKGGIQSGGVVNITGQSITNVNADNYYDISGGSFSLVASTGISDNNSDFTFIKQTGGQVTVSLNNYGWNPGVSANTTKAKVWSTGGTLVATGNLVQSRGAGTQGAGAGFFRIDADGPHVVTGNATPGWANTFPANSTTGTFQNNGGGATRFPSGLDVTGVGASIQGLSDGCHHTFQSGSGYIQCVYPGVGWRGLNIDALGVSFGSQYTPMTVNMYGTGGLRLSGHLTGIGTAPTVTTSTGTATPSAGINDTHGSIVVSAAATVTVKFALAYANPPDCIVSSRDGAKPTWSTTAGAAGTASLVVITPAAEAVTYHCLGQ